MTLFCAVNERLEVFQQALVRMTLNAFIPYIMGIIELSTHFIVMRFRESKLLVPTLPEVSVQQPQSSPESSGSCP